MKVSEIVYMVLDLAKAATSDDSFFTEEHALFLCKKYRAFLIKKEQEKNKETQDAASEFEYQQICLDLEKYGGDNCWSPLKLRTTKPIPKILEGSQPKVHLQDYYAAGNISFVSKDKMMNTGTNKYLQNIIYASLGPDFHLYLSSSNPQFSYLKKVRLSAIFEDFDDARDLLCDDDGQSQVCDILDMDFPIREHLVPPLIELVVKELTAGKYQISDTRNNAAEDIPGVQSRG